MAHEEGVALAFQMALVARLQRLAVRTHEDHHARDHIGAAAEVHVDAAVAARGGHLRHLGRVVIHGLALGVDAQGVALPGAQIRHQKLAHEIGLADGAVVLRHGDVGGAGVHHREGGVHAVADEHAAAHQSHGAIDLGGRQGGVAVLNHAA